MTKLANSMMRSTEEWVGKTPDQAAPDKVRERVFVRFHGTCHKCSRKLGVADKWTLEHVIAIENGGENRETNLDTTCEWCTPVKNAEDAKQKKKNTKIRRRYIGVSKKHKRRIHSRNTFELYQPRVRHVEDDR